MNFKYYTDIPTSHHIWFKLIDADGKIVKNYSDQVCFAAITHGFDHTATTIQIYHEKQLVPYSVAEVKRWIVEINDMGFPCTFEADIDPIIAKQVSYINNTVNEGLEDMTLTVMRHGNELPKAVHNFFVKISDYQDKNHMFSALFLIRCLLESGINRVPEEYFKLMDAAPERDKLEACQMAHKIVSCKSKPYDPTCYANIDHMVTYDSNGENITKSILMERFIKRKIDVRSNKDHLRISSNWNGSNNIYWQDKVY